MANVEHVLEALSRASTAVSDAVYGVTNAIKKVPKIIASVFTRRPK